MAVIGPAVSVRRLPSATSVPVSFTARVSVRFAMGILK
jgi:hypothetical protein